MWGVVFVAVTSRGALLSGAGPCNAAAAYWNRYAPTSSLNGNFACASTTAPGAVLELVAAVAPHAVTADACDAVTAVVQTLDPRTALNTCNSTTLCADRLTCIVDSGHCGYCAPKHLTPSHKPCFSGGVVSCKSLTYNGIAAGIGLVLSILTR